MHGHKFGALPESPPEGQKLSARNCHEYCDRSHGMDAWLAETDKWYCESCLVERFIAEIRAWTGKDEELEDWTFIARTDDLDEFTHFVCVYRVGDVVKNATITLHALESARELLVDNKLAHRRQVDRVLAHQNKKCERL